MTPVITIEPVLPYKIIGELIRHGKTCLVLGRSRVGKTELMRNIFKGVEKGTALVTNCYRKSDYKGLASFSYALTRKKGRIESWMKRMLENRIFVIEDLNILMTDPEISRIVKKRMEALITRRRYCLFVICQNLQGLGWFIRNFRTVVMFKLDSGKNLSLLLRTARTDIITERLSTLNDYEYFLIDTEAKRLSEHTYKNTQVEPILKTMLYGVNGYSYAPTKADTDNGKTGRPIEEDSLRQKVFAMLDEGTPITEITKKYPEKVDNIYHYKWQWRKMKKGYINK